MTTGTETIDFSALRDDLTALRRDVGGLIEAARSSASDGMSKAAGKVDDGAREIYRNAAAQGDVAVKSLSRQIEEQPVLTMLVVAAIGFIGGRLLLR